MESGHSNGKLIRTGGCGECETSRRNFPKISAHPENIHCHFGVNVVKLFALQREIMASECVNEWSKISRI
jgi:hypothetical protein